METALAQGKTFRVIVMDAPNGTNNFELVKHLSRLGVADVTYVWLHALAYVLPTVTRVVLGASALLSEGSVLGRVGTAGIALAAHHAGIPVLVCAETYKMSHRTTQEGGGLLPTMQQHGGYDVTPSHMVSAIVTKVGMLPPTLVAVLLREMKTGTSGEGGSGSY